MTTVKLLPGHRYYAGVDIPFFIPESLVVSKLEEMGGANVSVVDRDDLEPGALSFNPQAVDPKYEDDWAELVTVDYLGPEKTITIDRKWKWLVRVPLRSGGIVPPGAVGSPVPTAAKPASSSSLSGLGAALIITACVALVLTQGGKR